VEVTVMSLVIIAILLLLGVLILAGPMLEDLIDRIWPPRTHHHR
jgi:hypothetical protein